ncbi:hypothetical protein IQ07DRAFT_628121 [Pyrenochaeta sp. DS3sAY3a]|nr:hypothetical protein IQ07DRAFT_628121 [Pyrenochaeta sp. DS3sAY3a]
MVTYIHPDGLTGLTTMAPCLDSLRVYSQFLPAGVWVRDRAVRQLPTCSDMRQPRVSLTPPRIHSAYKYTSARCQRLADYGPQYVNDKTFRPTFPQSKDISERYPPTQDTWQAILSALLSRTLLGTLRVPTKMYRFWSPGRLRRSPRFIPRSRFRPMK